MGAANVWASEHNSTCHWLVSRACGQGAESPSKRWECERHVNVMGGAGLEEVAVRRMSRRTDPAMRGEKDDYWDEEKGNDCFWGVK